jgi:ferredoxin
MKIVINLDRCMGHGQCELVAPEIFELDEQGIAHALTDHVGETLRSKAEQAARRCLRP